MICALVRRPGQDRTARASPIKRNQSLHRTTRRFAPKREFPSGGIVKSIRHRPEFKKLKQVLVENACPLFRNTPQGRSTLDRDFRPRRFEETAPTDFTRAVDKEFVIASIVLNRGRYRAVVKFESLNRCVELHKYLFLWSEWRGSFPLQKSKR